MTPDTDATDDPSSALVVDGGSGDAATCQRLLRAAGEERAELHVTVSGGGGATAADALADRPGGSAAVVAVGTSNARTVAADWGIDHSRVTTVDDPADLRGIATAIVAACDGLAPASVAVCVDGLVPLVDATGPDDVASLLGAVTDRLVGNGAVVHYHADADAIGATTRDAVADVVDAVVEADGGGTGTADEPNDLVPVADDAGEADDDTADEDPPSETVSGTADGAVAEASDDDVARLADDEGDAGETRDSDAPEEASDEDVADAFGA